MTDQRELILSRIVELLSAATGFANVVRNRGNLSETKRPYAALFDGDEEANADDPDTRQTNSPRRITMRPEIFIYGQAAPESIGSEVNILRAKVVKALCTDATLAALTAERTGVRYDGMTNSLSAGRTINAELALHFVFRYYLRPDGL